MTTTATYPYQVTLKASEDVPDRVIESRAFLSMYEDISARAGCECMMRLILREEDRCAIASDETVCEVEIVRALGADVSPCRIPHAMRQQVLSCAIDLVRRHFDIARDRVDDSEGSAFERRELHDHSLRFNIDEDICRGLQRSDRRVVRDLAARPNVELLRMP